ncbi:MAG: diaminopimelate decarboxylase [Candidatus Micrarchaeota archaeon]|nr:diaminopimelate decarboxylase [Candidatus Micrarchaeota archaeon]
MLLAPLSSNSNNLIIGKIPIKQIYLKFGPGPIYIYDEQRIRENFKRLQKAFFNSEFQTKIYFAIKANSNPAIIKILSSQWAGADCSNLNEIEIARLCNIKKENILYSPNYCYIPDLVYAAKNKIPLNFDSLSSFQNFLSQKSIQDLELKDLIISFRYNPKRGIGQNKKIITAGKNSKFGLEKDELLLAYRLAKKKGICRFGLHMMSGSNTLTISPFVSQLQEQLAVAGLVVKKLKINFEFIDIGGGFGVRYHPKQKELDIEKLGRVLSKTFIEGCIKNKIKSNREGFNFPTLILEPGRILVADSAVLVSEITDIKHKNSKKIIGIYASMASLIRPAFYGSYHHIYIDGKLNSKKKKADIVGQACESSDYFAFNRPIAENAKVGDLVVICTAGAYGFSMSSNYCTMPRAAEVLVNQKKLTLIRKRENVQNILALCNFNQK